MRNRLSQLLSRPKQLAAVEACSIGLVAGLAAMALGESVQGKRIRFVTKDS